jgi:hypothetical protein
MSPIARLVAPALAALVVHTGATARAADCGPPCGDDRGCAIEQGLCLVEAGSPKKATKLLKPLHGADPADGPLARLLALAYLDAGNAVWATRTLLTQLEAAPDDHQTRTWAAWLLIQQGDLAQARDLLDRVELPEDDPLAGRAALLEVVLTRLEQGDDEAAAKLAEIAERDGEMFPEDVELYEDLRSQLSGNPGAPIKLRALLSGGYTTNATQSAPQDTGAGREQTGAGVMALDLVLRIEPWTSPLVRPLGEIRAKGFTPFGEEVGDLSYLNLGGRAGGEIGRVGELRARLLYSYELFGLLDDGWYMTAHRGELELDLLPWLQVFGGAGRRIYAHLPRTRTEMDVGAALVFPLPGGWNITGIVAGRMQLARHPAFDDRGLTGLLRLRVPLPSDFMIKLRVMGLYDVFPDSAAYYDSTRRRRDFLLKVEVGPWTPSFHGFRVGATYTLSHRMSTIDEGLENFDYTDHRFLLQVRWEGSFDPSLPGEASVGDEHLELPYGLGGDGDSGLDRVQDLLRQEDSARRGSMCVD